MESDYDRWKRKAEAVVDAGCDRMPYSKEAFVTDVAQLMQDEVTVLAINVEKRLCCLLGREWSASGMSIETLTNDLKSKLSG